MDDISIVKRNATADEYIMLRESVGWDSPDKAAVITGLNNSLFSVCAEKGNELIGHGRLIGDGGFMVYMQDILVKPEYQHAGIGTKIVDELMSFINNTYTHGCTLCLMAAKGKEGFYKKFGFIERPNEIFGAGMIQIINKRI